MSESFETRLRDGTAQVTASFTPPSAAAVRAYSGQRARRRTTGTVALAACAVLLVGGAVLGLDQQRNGHSGVPHASAGVPTTSPSGSPTQPGKGSVSIRLSEPALYAAATANKVGLTFSNSGPARHVVVQFDAPGSDSLYWVEPCDSGAGSGCSPQQYQDNPLRVATDQGSPRPGFVDFDLALPAGTSSYTVWVDPPGGVTSYRMFVLHGTTVLGLGVSGQIHYAFPTLTTASQGSTTLVRGGAAVEFGTEVTDATTTSYVNLSSYTSVSCKAGQSSVTLPQGAYTLQWSAGKSWQNVGNLQYNGQFGYSMSPGQSTTTRFRLALTDSLPSDVTSCQVTQLVSATPQTAPPYYDQSDPTAHTVVNFSVG